MNKKIKIILIIALIAASLVFAYLILRTLFESPKLTPGDEPTLSEATSTEPISPLEPAAESPAKKISTHPVFDYVINRDMKSVFYFEENGLVWSVENGENTNVSNENIPALNSIRPNASGTSVLIASGNPNAPSWSIFRPAQKILLKLPETLVNAAWDETENSIIGVMQNENEFPLIRLDISEDPPKQEIIVRDFRFKDTVFSVFPGGRLIIAEKPSSEFFGRVWQFDLATKTLNLLFEPARGLVLFHPEGTDAVFFFSSPNQFLILNQVFEELAPIPFTTLPEKCGADKNGNAYCFIPQEIPGRVLLPDDYFTRAFYSIDDLYQINTETGKTDILFVSGSGGIPAIDGMHPEYMEGKLYFVNRYDKGLYEIQL